MCAPQAIYRARGDSFSVAAGFFFLASSRAVRLPTLQADARSRPFIDLFSCLLFFTHTLTPTPDHHQLSIILDILGTPSIDDFYAISSQRR
jgi:hypothetical protein